MVNIKEMAKSVFKKTPSSLTELSVLSEEFEIGTRALGAHFRLQ